MYDEFKAYQKNHNTNDVKNTELKKIAKDCQTLSAAIRKMQKHKFRDEQELEEHYDEMLEAEYLIKKTGRNINTRKQRLLNFIKNGHVE